MYYIHAFAYKPCKQWMDVGAKRVKHIKLREWASLWPLVSVLLLLLLLWRYKYTKRIIKFRVSGHFMFTRLTGGAERVSERTTGESSVGAGAAGLEGGAGCIGRVGLHTQEHTHTETHTGTQTHTKTHRNTQKHTNKHTHTQKHKKKHTETQLHTETHQLPFK